jgi:GPH family glycoside/pentoside/hexuronide:cation symporter
MALEQHHITSSDDKVPIGQKIGYGLGGMVTQVAVNSTSNLFLPIYNIGLGVSPALLGMGQGIPRVLDAIIDPLVGNLSDNTRSRFGRRIPYVFVGGILLGVTFALLWMVPKGLSEYTTFVYFLIMSMLFYIATSIFEIPRGALGLEMSNDYHERTRLFAYYSFIVNVGALTTPWLYWLATRKNLFADEVAGMRTIGAAMGCLFVVSSVICAVVCKEQKLKQAKTQDKVKLWDGIIMTSRNRTFVRLLVITCLVTIGFNFVVGFSSYILIYYVFNGDKQAASVWMGWCGTLWALLSLVGVFVMTWIATHLGKSKTMMIFLIIMATGNLLKIVCYNRTYPWLVLIPTAAIAMGMLVLFTLVFAMIADICDEDELKTGKRREGSYQAMYWWWFKIGVGLAFVVAGFLLKSTGINEKLIVQSDSTLFWLRFWEITLPSVVCFCGAMLLIKYPLTEQRAYEIKTILAQRKRASVSSQSVIAEPAAV